MADRIEFGRFKASADADTWQYNFVRHHTTADQFNLANGASGPVALGVLQNDPKSGEAGTICIMGVTKVKGDASGTAIGIGDFICAGSTGMAVIGSGSAINGIALEALASGASVLIDVFLFPPQLNMLADLQDNTP